MAHTRRNLANLPAWDPILLWYARAITAMQARPRRQSDSWGWQAAIHGWHPSLAVPGEPLPSAADQRRYWNQCQHGSWYFLPWHRGYLAAFEQIVRRKVVELGGPGDWALPYWDMRQPAWRRLRREFCVPQLPDGNPNALFVTRRRAGFETGNVGIDAAGVDLRRILIEPEFGGSGSGGSPGFGGPRTGFFHGPGTTGALEGGLHNYIHGRVGGPGGFMSSFEMAGLDPLFWLHHCNIDRLWEVWRTRDPAHRDPTASQWRTGPTDRRFTVRDAAGQPWVFTSREMIDTRGPRLDYVYEDIADPLRGAPLPLHLQGFARAEPAGGGPMGIARRPRRTSRVLGAIAPGVELGGLRATARVAVTAPRPRRLQGVAAAAPQASRLLLNLENITGIDGAQAYKVFVNLPDDGDPATAERNLAGVMSLFGVETASDPDEEHGGNGLSYVFDITEIAGSREGLTGGNEVTVDFVSMDDDTPQGSARVGRISIVRETG